MTLPGSKIRIKFQAPKNRSDLNVRATLRNESDVLLSASPVTVTHVGNGLYTNNAVTMPVTSEVKITLEVFRDAGFTKPFSTRFISVIQTVTNNTQQHILDAISDLDFAAIQKVIDKAIALGHTNLSIEIEEEENITLVFDSDPELLIEIQDDEILDIEVLTSQNFILEVIDEEIITIEILD